MVGETVVTNSFLQGKTPAASPSAPPGEIGSRGAIGAQLRRDNPLSLMVAHPAKNR